MLLLHANQYEYRIYFVYILNIGMYWCCCPTSFFFFLPIFYSFHCFSALLLLCSSFVLIVCVIQYSYYQKNTTKQVEWPINLFKYKYAHNIITIDHRLSEVANHTFCATNNSERWKKNNIFRVIIGFHHRRIFD